MSAPCLACLWAKYTTTAPPTLPGNGAERPARPSERRRSAAPFRRFRCRMGGRWDVALARFCWISCTVGAVVLPATARTQDRALSACRFEVAGTGKVRAISDGRSFILEDGREIRLAAIEVPLAPAAGESGPRAEACLAARAALESMLASQSVVELRHDAAGADRYGRTLAMVHVSATALGNRSRTRCWREDSHGFRPMSAIGLAPRNFRPRNGERAAPSLASGVNRIMSSWQPRAVRSLRPSVAVSPWRKGTCCRSARVQERST